LPNEKRPSPCGDGRLFSTPVRLERITITRNHFMVSCDRVNPLYINEIEQIHTFRRNREAIPHEGDLL